MLRRTFATLALTAPLVATVTTARAQLRSPASETPAWLTIRNFTGVPLESCWIDFDGNYQSYGVIAPGASMEQSTYAGHLWALRNAATRVDFGTVSARPGRQTLDVTAAGVTVR